MNDEIAMEIIERMAKLEQKVADRNGWLKAIERRVCAIDKRVWGLLVAEIGLIISIVMLIIKGG